MLNLHLSDPTGLFFQVRVFYMRAGVRSHQQAKVRHSNSDNVGKHAKSLKSNEILAEILTQNNEILKSSHVLEENKRFC